MSAGADAEDKTENHPVTPGAPKPERELYGVMLLESGNGREALVAFEALTCPCKFPPRGVRVRPQKGDGR